MRYGHPAAYRSAHGTATSVYRHPFLVADLPERKEIGMRKGQVSVTTGCRVRNHRKASRMSSRLSSRSQDAIVKEKREFEEYKANTEREFVEFNASSLWEPTAWRASMQTC